MLVRIVAMRMVAKMVVRMVVRMVVVKMVVVNVVNEFFHVVGLKEWTGTFIFIESNFIFNE